MFKCVSISLLLFISCLKCTAQSIEMPNIDLVQQNIGKNIFQKTVNGDLTSTYLGEIRNENGAVKFYVVREFSRIKAAIVYHGNSRLIFYNVAKKFKAQYQFDMPDELPFKLKSNRLYFRDSDQKPIRILSLKINQHLPEQIFNSHSVSFSQ
jgi:hypothetical protein